MVSMGNGSIPRCPGKAAARQGAGRCYLSEDFPTKGSNDMATTPMTLRASEPARFYLYAALGAAIVVFIGFAPSYFLKGIFGAPPLYPLLHLHGFIMTSWFVLFAAQTWLVAARRVRLHRRLGILGVLLASAILIVGTAVLIIGTRLGHNAGLPAPMVVCISLVNFLVFGVLVAAAIGFRGRSEFHKRLMLLATLNLLTAPISRIPLQFIQSGGTLAVFGSLDLIILICVGYDTVRHRRLHAAFAWGALLSVVWPVLAIQLGGTSVSNRFANWLLS